MGRCEIRIAELSTQDTSTPPPDQLEEISRVAGADSIYVFDVPSSGTAGAFDSPRCSSIGIMNGPMNHVPTNLV